jgi:DNA-binding transcriptional LysR family regulator
MDRLQAMHMFVKVAESGSFIAVAHQLQLARSAVTRQIAALETYLGTKLITRSTRSLTLTAAGSAYLEKCRVILNMVDAAESSLGEEVSALRGRIRVGLPLSFGLQELLPALLDFARRNEHIELVMDLSDHRANLIEEGLDVAVRITSDLAQGDIVRLLGRCRLLTVASPAYLSRFGEPLHPGDLQHHECLIYSREGVASQWSYREGDRSLQVPVRGRLVANNGVLLTDAASRGMGLALQPDFIVAPYLEQGKLVTVLQDFECDPPGIYALLPSNRYIPHRVSVFIDHLAGVLADEPAGRRS